MKGWGGGYVERTYMQVYFLVPLCLSFKLLSLHSSSLGSYGSYPHFYPML
jgi:hypothetical protein